MIVSVFLPVVLNEENYTQWITSYPYRDYEVLTNTSDCYVETLVISALLL